jgi:hypothetical protein
VEFKPEASNVVDDAHSRRDTEALATAFTISASTFTLFDNLRAEHTTDPALAELRLEVMRGDRGTGWTVVDDLVTYCGRIYINASSPSLQDVLTSSHGMGHEGAQKTASSPRQLLRPWRAHHCLRLRACLHDLPAQQGRPPPPGWLVASPRGPISCLG